MSPNGCTGAGVPRDASLVLIILQCIVNLVTELVIDFEL